MWFGIGAPKNTPVEIVDKLNKDRARARRSSVTEKQVPSGIGRMTHAVLSRHPRLSFQTVTMAPTLSIITDDMSTHPILGEVQHSLAPSVKTTNRTGERSSAVNRHILGDTGVSFELNLRRTAGRPGSPNRRSRDR